jgi:hypothetical protein
MDAGGSITASKNKAVFFFSPGKSGMLGVIFVPRAP